MFKKKPDSSMISSDMPSGPPKPAQSISAPVERPTRLRPAPTPTNSSGWQPMFQSFLVGILGVLLGSYIVNNGLSKKSHDEQRHQISFNAWDRLVGAGVVVDVDRSKLATDGQLYFSELKFHNVENLNELRKAVIYSTMMPGIRSLSFRPIGNDGVGAGVTDDSVLQLVTKGFSSLEVLDLTSTRVESLRLLTGLPIKHLMIANVPIAADQFEWLAKLESVSELSIGWSDRALSKDSRYLSPQYKAKLLETVKSMKNLKIIYVYDIDFNEKERLLIPHVRIVPAFLTSR